MSMPILSSLSPFGPIFDKELRVTARRKRTYVLRVAYLGLLLLVMLWASAVAGVFDSIRGGVAQRQQQLAMLGMIFFGAFSIFSVCSMALIGPVLTANAVNSERLRKTLHVLLMTPISSWQIVSGKLMSRLWIALTLIGLSLPVLALVRLLGSVELSQMFIVIALAAVTALATASIGLFFSTLINRVYAVLLLAYATVLFLYLFVPMIAGMLAAAGYRSAGPPNGLFTFITAVSPPAAAMMQLVPVRSSMPVAWIACLVVQSALAVILLLCSGLILRRMARHAGQSAGAAVEVLPPPLPVAAGAAGEAGGISNAAAMPISVAIPRASRQRNVGDNPVLWREVRRPLFARRWMAITALMLVCLLLGVTYFGLAANNALDESGIQNGFAFVFNALLMFLICILSATAIAQEKESDTWTLLLASPLSGKAIVLGKALGICRRLMWPMVLIVAHFVFFCLFMPRVLDLADILVIVWILLSFNSIWLATGLYLSLRLRSATMAIILNLLLPLMLYILVPVALAIVGELFDYRNLSEWGVVFTPYVYLSEAIKVLRPYSHPWLPLSHYVDGWTFIGFVAVVGVVLLLASALIVNLTIIRFNRIVRRADG